MWQRTSLILFLLLSQAVSYAQTDTLLLVRQSRVAFCNTKIAENAILKERLEVKGSEIVLLEEKVGLRNQTITSLERSITIKDTQINLVQEQDKISKATTREAQRETKQLRKENIFLKIGVVALTILAVINLYQ